MRHLRHGRGSHRRERRRPPIPSASAPLGTRSPSIRERRCSASAMAPARSAEVAGPYRELRQWFASRSDQHPRADHGSPDCRSRSRSGSPSWPVFFPSSSMQPTWPPTRPASFAVISDGTGQRRDTSSFGAIGEKHADERRSLGTIISRQGARGHRSAPTPRPSASHLPTVPSHSSDGDRSARCSVAALDQASARCARVVPLRCTTAVSLGSPARHGPAPVVVSVRGRRFARDARCVT